MDWIRKLTRSTRHVLHEVWQDTKKIVKIASIAVKDFFVGLYNNAEGVAILTLAVSGLSSLLGEVPFWMTLPAWVESPMVIPVICVIIITLLVKSMEKRQTA